MVTQDLWRNLPASEAGVVSRSAATLDGARHFAAALEQIERSRGSTVNEARRRIATRVRVGFGTFENIVRDRVKRVDARIRDRLCALLVRELETEIARLSHELEMVRQSGGHLGAEHVREIEAHLSAARSILGKSRGTRA